MIVKYVSISNCLGTWVVLYDRLLLRMGANPAAAVDASKRPVLDSADPEMRQVFVESVVQAVAMSNVEHVDRMASGPLGEI